MTRGPNGSGGLGIQVADELPPPTPEKFTVLRITTSKRHRRETNYFLRGQRLQVIDSAK